MKTITKLISFCLLFGSLSAFAFSDYFIIKAPKDAVIQATASSGNILIHTPLDSHCDDGVCFFWLSNTTALGDGSATVSIGPDENHRCTFRIYDGVARIAKFLIPPACSGGYHTASKMSHTLGSSVWFMTVYPDKGIF